MQRYADRNSAGSSPLTRLAGAPVDSLEAFPAAGAVTAMKAEL